MIAGVVSLNAPSGDAWHAAPAIASWLYGGTSLQSQASFHYLNKRLRFVQLYVEIMPSPMASQDTQQPIQRLYQGLETLASPERYLFTPADMRALVPELGDTAYKTLLSRAAKGGKLQRFCRGLYIFLPAKPILGLALFHAAARLRAHELNYISLETALSDAGVISQIPINWITLMSSGRSNIIRCGDWGTIEFVHTRQPAADLAQYLTYDGRCRLWRASISRSIRDMKMARRNLDLIDWSIVDELV